MKSIPELIKIIDDVSDRVEDEEVDAICNSLSAILFYFKHSDSISAKDACTIISYSLDWKNDE